MFNIKLKSVAMKYRIKTNEESIFRSCTSFQVIIYSKYGKILDIINIYNYGTSLGTTYMLTTEKHREILNFLLSEKLFIINSINKNSYILKATTNLLLQII